MTDTEKIRVRIVLEQANRDRMYLCIELSEEEAMWLVEHSDTFKVSLARAAAYAIYATKKSEE